MRSFIVLVSTFTIARNFNTVKREIQIKPFLLGCVYALIAFTLPAQPLRSALKVGPSTTLVIPVAGSVAGAMGTHFRTDLTVTNELDVEQVVSIGFYAQGQPYFWGDPASETSLVLAARSTTIFEDVVADYLHSSGLGSIVINRPGSSGSGAKLAATYRIWTEGPGQRGEVSQSSEAIALEELSGGSRVRVITGVRLDNDFRCNVGIFNFSDADRSYRITAASVFGSVSSTVSVGAFSMEQVPLDFRSLGYVTVTVQPLDSEEPDLWTAYATSVDNRSGDSWLQNASSLDPTASIVIPVAANIRGALGTLFRTDLSIFNHLDTAQVVAIRFYARGQQFFYGDPAVETSVLLEPNSTTIMRDVVSGLLRADGVGSILINPIGWSDFRPEAKLTATYRIWTDGTASPGQMSQSSVGLDLETVGEGLATRVIAGVKLDANFRCNVGIFNYSYYDRSYLITARSRAGSVAVTAWVGAYSMEQVSLPPADLGYVTVTIEPIDAEGSDIWTAYASSVDNRNGDSWLQNAYPR